MSDPYIWSSDPQVSIDTAARIIALQDSYVQLSSDINDDAKKAFDAIKKLKAVILDASKTSERLALSKEIVDTCQQVSEAYIKRSKVRLDLTQEISNLANADKTGPEAGPDAAHVAALFNPNNTDLLEKATHISDQEQHISAMLTESFNMFFQLSVSEITERFYIFDKFIQMFESIIYPSFEEWLHAILVREKYYFHLYKD
jgi:hypothetical protein